MARHRNTDLDETTVLEVVADDLDLADEVPADDDVPTGEDALVLRGVRKTFPSGLFGRGPGHVAVDGLDLRVRAGSVHAVLGPNGAGKTTTVSMVATLLAPDEGTITVDGIDVRADPAQVRRRIGVSGQYAAVDGTLTGFENLRLVGQLYQMSRREASRRARELIEQLDLTAAADRPMQTYSGGMRRRLDLAGAVINRPRLVILDEPTTGLDPRGRRQIWDVIGGLVESGTTILLTTQYLEEADELADEITLIDGGEVRARGTPEALKRELGTAVLSLEVAPQAAQRADDVLLALGAIGTGRPEQTGPTRFRVPVGDGTRSAVSAVKALDNCRVDVVDAAVDAPTLDTVFLALTGGGETPSPDRQEADDVR